MISTTLRGPSTRKCSHCGAGSSICRGASSTYRRSLSSNRAATSGRICADIWFTAHRNARGSRCAPTQTSKTSRAGISMPRPVNLPARMQAFGSTLTSCPSMRTRFGSSGGVWSSAVISTLPDGSVNFRLCVSASTRVAPCASMAFTKPLFHCGWSATIPAPPGRKMSMSVLRRCCHCAARTVPPPMHHEVPGGRTGGSHCSRTATVCLNRERAGSFRSRVGADNRVPS